MSLGHGLCVLLCVFVRERMLGSHSHVWLYILGDWVIHVVPEAILCLFVFCLLSNFLLPSREHNINSTRDGEFLLNSLTVSLAFRRVPKLSRHQICLLD